MKKILVFLIPFMSLLACQGSLQSEGASSQSTEGGQGGGGGVATETYANLIPHPDNPRYFLDLKTSKPVLVVTQEDSKWEKIEEGGVVDNRKFGAGARNNPDSINEDLELRWQSEKPVNATGFGEGVDSPVLLRRQVWTSLLSGSHVHVKGAGPGAGASTILSNVRRFVEESGWDFVWSYPNKHHAGVQAGFCMSHLTYEYVCYFPAGGQKSMVISMGTYDVRWWNPREGGFTGPVRVDHPGEGFYVTPPTNEDWVIHVRSVASKPVYPAGTKCFPLPPKLQRMNLVIHNHPRPYRFVMDSTPLVRSGEGIFSKYCQKIMNDPYRNDCPVRPEGDPMRVVCERVVVGVAMDGKLAPQYTVTGGAELYRHPDNPYLAIVNTNAGISSVVTSCSNTYKDVCSSVTLPTE